MKYLSWACVVEHLVSPPTHTHTSALLGGCGALGTRLYLEEMGLGWAVRLIAQLYFLLFLCFRVHSDMSQKPDAAAVTDSGCSLLTVMSLFLQTELGQIFSLFSGI